MGLTSREQNKVENNILVNNLISKTGFNNSNNIYTTELIHSSSNITLIENLAQENTADIQLEKKIIIPPKGTNIKTRKILQLLLNVGPGQNVGDACNVSQYWFGDKPGKYQYHRLHYIL